MEVTLKLYKNYSGNSYVSKNISAGPEYTCTIKSNCTVEEPKFLLELPSGANIVDFNYAYCPEFGRYYYVTKRGISLGGLFEIQCEVDPLMSFGGGIRGLTALVERQEFKYNPYIEDPGICIGQGSVVKMIKGSKVGEDTYSMYLTAVGSYDSTSSGGGGQ